MGGKTKARIQALWEEIEVLEEDQENARDAYKRQLGILEELTRSLSLSAMAQVNHECRITSQKKRLDDLYKTIETWEKKLQAKSEADYLAAQVAASQQVNVNRLAEKLQALDDDLTWRVLNLEVWAGKAEQPVVKMADWRTRQQAGEKTGHDVHQVKATGLDSQPAKTTGDHNTILAEEEADVHPDVYKNASAWPDQAEIVADAQKHREEEKVTQEEDTQWLDGLLEMLAEPASRGEMMLRLDVLYARGCTCTAEQQSGPENSRCHSCFAGETLKRIKHQYIRDMCNLPTGGENTSFTVVMEAVDRLEHKFKRNMNLGRNAGQAVGVENVGLYADSEGVVRDDEPFATAVGPEAGYSTSVTDAEPVKVQRRAMRPPPDGEGVE